MWPRCLFWSPASRGVQREQAELARGARGETPVVPSGMWPCTPFVLRTELSVDDYCKESPAVHGHGQAAALKKDRRPRGLPLGARSSMLGSLRVDEPSVLVTKPLSSLCLKWYIPSLPCPTDLPVNVRALTRKHHTDAQALGSSPWMRGGLGVPCFSVLAPSDLPVNVRTPRARKHRTDAQALGSSLWKLPLSGFPFAGSCSL